MSRYTYAGPFKNPTEGWTVEQYPEGHEHAGKFFVGVPEFCECGAACCSKPQIGVRPHTKANLFEEAEEAHEWIEGTEEFFEQDYEEYLEENSHEIARMEQYEAWKNEY